MNAKTNVLLERIRDSLDESSGGRILGPTPNRNTERDIEGYAKKLNAVLKLLSRPHSDMELRKRQLENAQYYAELIVAKAEAEIARFDD